MSGDVFQSKGVNKSDIGFKTRREHNFQALIKKGLAIKVMIAQQSNVAMDFKPIGISHCAHIKHWHIKLRNILIQRHSIFSSET